jgi:hypothetical protein
MSEWWTYSLSDFLLFSPRTYRHLIELYNAQAWPLHLLAMALGIGMAWLLWRGGTHSQRMAAIMLAVCWAWVGFAFFERHYATINWAASHVAIAFGLQAAMLAIIAARRTNEAARPRHAMARRGWISLLAFGLLLQPLIGLLLGRPWRQLELFGIAPDPTVTVTLALLAMQGFRGSRLVLWPIPLLWCAVSAATLWTMHDTDAWVMPAVAVAALATASLSRRQ